MLECVHAGAYVSAQDSASVVLPEALTGLPRIRPLGHGQHMPAVAELRVGAYLFVADPQNLAGQQLEISISLGLTDVTVMWDTGFKLETMCLQGQCQPYIVSSRRRSKVQPGDCCLRSGSAHRVWPGIC